MPALDPRSSTLSPKMIATAMRSAARRTRAPLCLLQRSMCTAPDVVVVSIEDAKAKTAAALRMIGWDDEDAQLLHRYGHLRICFGQITFHL